MNILHIEHIPYHADSSELFSRLVSLPGAIFLDSSSHQTKAQGRYDIISAMPDIKITSINSKTKVTTQTCSFTTNQNPLTLLQRYLKQVKIPHHDLPFIGGMLGYFSYDFAHQLEKLPNNTRKDTLLPEMCVGIYSWAIVVDHHQQQTYLTHLKTPWPQQNTLADIKNIINNPIAPLLIDFKLTKNFQCDIEKTKYQDSFNKIIDYITAGDCYQVNYTHRFSAEFKGSPWHAYKMLRQINPAPFSAYIPTDKGAILSLSPERFLQVKDNLVETKPIKGTRPRHIDTHHDNALADELRNSEKDRAENLMIVDLMRNDISRVCEPDSVVVPKLFDLESFTSVHHLVSTVQGKLKYDKTAIDLLQYCFPGGSITGTPKIRAMEIIDELEITKRNIYCGSIAYIDFSGNMDSNIAIRTLLCEENHIYCSAGGAIVAESNCENEYQETFHKVDIILNSLNHHQVKKVHVN